MVDNDMVEPDRRCASLTRPMLIIDTLLGAVRSTRRLLFRYPPAPGTWITAEQAHPAAVERHFFASVYG